MNPLPIRVLSLVSVQSADVDRFTSPPDRLPFGFRPDAIATKDRVEYLRHTSVPDDLEE